VSAAVDWTVEQLLSGAQMLSARAEHARNTLRAARDHYMQTLRNLPSIPDLQARESARAKLREWIHRQVELENRYAALAAQWAAAKARVKMFLQSVHVTPPAYLGFLPAALVPVAVWGLVAAGLGLVATIIVAAVNHSKSLDSISSIVQMAAREGWTAEQTAQALRQVVPPPPDPLGLTATLKAALPLVLVAGAFLVLGPMLQRKARAA
jgi:hypothetical protein